MRPNTQPPSTHLLAPIGTAAASLDAAGDAADRALLRQIAAGDPHAFEQFYLRYTPRLAAYLPQRLGPSALVEDVVQEVMVVVWQQAAAYRARASVSTWLFGIARHTASKAWRRWSPTPSDAPPAVETEQ